MKEIMDKLGKVLLKPLVFVINRLQTRFVSCSLAFGFPKYSKALIVGELFGWDKIT